MAIPLSPPPHDASDKIAWGQWVEAVWRYVRGSVTTSGDAAYTIGSAATYHGVTALSAARILTLPPSELLQDGDEIMIQDESGSAGTYTITISADSGDTINGTATITSNYGRRRLIKRGSGAWFSA